MCILPEGSGFKLPAQEPLCAILRAARARARPRVCDPSADVVAVSSRSEVSPLHNALKQKAENGAESDDLSALYFLDPPWSHRLTRSRLLGWAATGGLRI